MHGMCYQFTGETLIRQYFTRVHARIQKGETGDPDPLENHAITGRHHWTPAGGGCSLKILVYWYRPPLPSVKNKPRECGIMTNVAGLDPEGLFTGGRGGTSRPKLEPSGTSRERGGEYEWRGGSLEGGSGELPRKFFKIYVSENAFQAILKPSFPYSITPILSKVRHSNPRGVGGGWYSDIFIHT